MLFLSPSSNFKNLSQTKFAANVQKSPLDNSLQSQEFSDNNAVLYKEFQKFMEANHSNVSFADPSSTINFAGKFFAFHASSSIIPSNKHVWIVDTGASDHMANSLEVLTSIV